MNLCSNGQEFVHHENNEEHEEITKPLETLFRALRVIPGKRFVSFGLFRVRKLL
jgi:hypothetical protein